MIRQSAQQRKDREDRILEHFIQFQYTVRYLLPDALCPIPFRDCEVMAEQFDDREIGSCLAIRDGWRFKDAPIRRHMGMHKLIDQA